MLLGYYDSFCVGVNHYRNNGARQDREMLLLLRDPGNRYDRHAITVCNKSWKQVGNVKVGGHPFRALLPDMPARRRFPACCRGVLIKYQKWGGLVKLQ